MKKMNLILTALLSGAILFTGCGKSDSEDNPENELSGKEEIIYDSLIEGIDAFYCPQAVRVLECSDIIQLIDDQNPYFIDVDIAHCYINISAQTKAGGTSNDVFCLVTDINGSSKYPRGSMWTYEDVIDSVSSYGIAAADLGFYNMSDYQITPDDEIDVGKINKALKFHWEELGLD
ncbi:MAG: hypothetical protein ACI4JB_07775 [Porcipelethomonas sp.]